MTSEQQAKRWQNAQTNTQTKTAGRPETQTTPGTDLYGLRQYLRQELSPIPNALGG
jgi:hypothetical protein